MIFLQGELVLGVMSPKGWTTFEYYTDVVGPADPLNPFKCAPYV